MSQDRDCFCPCLFSPLSPCKVQNHLQKKMIQQRLSCCNYTQTNLNKSLLKENLQTFRNFRMNGYICLPFGCKCTLFIARTPTESSNQPIYQCQPEDSELLTTLQTTKQPTTSSLYTSSPFISSFPKTPTSGTSSRSQVSKRGLPRLLVCGRLCGWYVSSVGFVVEISRWVFA